MTAENAGKLAADGFWGTLRTARDHWLLLAFAAGALFWARDLYDEFVDLPARVAAQEQAVSSLDARLTGLSARRAVPGDRSPALIFPGSRHGIGDGKPGESVLAELDPAEWRRADCLSRTISAFMIGADGQWHSVETSLRRLPVLTGQQRLAFSVRIHPALRPGRARFLLQVVQDCATHRQVDSSPLLHFRVLEP